MLSAHMNAIEASIIQQSQIPANSGHPVNRGTPREIFIKEFLQGHLSENVAIGSGEIIDSNSAPRQPRNQFDIIIYKKNYPKLDFGGGIGSFLIESVIATIEVKSLLDQTAIDQSIQAAHNSKNLAANINTAFSTGWIPPKILNFVVAYKGPAKIQTVHTWINNAHKNANIPMPAWTQDSKITTPGTALDGVFVLQSGFVKLDNTPLTLNKNHSAGTHVICDSKQDNLLMLFLSLQEACNNIHGAWLNPLPYVQKLQFPNVSIV